MKAIPLVAAVALFAAGPAFAASSTTTPPSHDSGQMQPLNHSNLREQLHDQLTKQGFTAIKIMPSSFYVQAKDQKGNPVAMVIGPDSFTEVTEMKPQASAQTAPSTPSSQTPAPTTQK